MKNLYYTHDITPKRVASVRPDFTASCLSNTTLKKRRDGGAVGGTVCDLTGPGIEPKTALTENDVFAHGTKESY